MEREYITVKQAAAVAHVDPNTVRRWMAAGKLARYKIEGRVLVDAAELDSKISRQPAGAAG